MKVTYAAIGLQYDLATHFLDKRGMLIDAGIKLLGKESEIGIASLSEEIMVQNKQQGLKLIVNPAKTVLEWEYFDSKDAFKKLVEQFTEHVADLYSRNQFSFVGVIYRLTMPVETNSIHHLFPIFSESSLPAGPIAAMRLTYLSNPYRIHLELNISGDSCIIGYDCQKVYDISFQDIVLLVDQAYEKAIRFAQTRRIQ